jgi:hypothetical protein
MRGLAGIVVGVLTLGCGDDGSTGDSGHESGATSSNPTSTSAMTSPNTSSDPDAGSANGTSEATTEPNTSGPPATSSTTDATTMPADSSDDNDTNGACGPPPPDDACLQCVVPDCCDAWALCQADASCACVIECHVIGGSSLGSCKSQCDHDGELYQGVFFCGQQTCLGNCDWSCC